MYSFPIGSEVRARDGVIGALTQVVQDRYTGEVTDLLVNLRGSDDSVVLPRSQVVSWDDDGILMDIMIEDLAGRRVYQEADFQACEPRNAGVGPGEAMNWQCRYGAEAAEDLAAIGTMAPPELASGEIGVGRDTRVMAGDHRIGRVDHVLMDRRTGRLTHLVMRPDGSGRSVVVPISRVESMDSAGVHVKSTHDEWQQLPTYTPRADSAIASEVRECLADVGCDVEEIDVTVDRGVVTLEGPAYEVETKREVDRRVREIEGVVGLENALSVDSAIAAEITGALANDPRTNLVGVDVASNHGTVTLSGEVETQEEKEAAEEIANRVRGVLLVINELVVVKGSEHRPGGIFVFGPQLWRTRYNWANYPYW